VPDDAETERLAADHAAYDTLYQAWLAKNPGRPLSEFTHRKVASGLAKGRPHASLGPRLVDDADWATHGLPAFGRLMQVARITPDRKVCEVGCGSARVGVHVTRAQQPDGYWGLDILPDFFRYAPDLIGPDLMADKRPRFGLIPGDVDRVVAWAPDLVFTTSVARHIPPEEEDGHYQLLRKLAHGAGARVLFEAHIAPAELRFARSGWARPVAHYQRLMQPFVLQEQLDCGVRSSNGYDIQVLLLAFAQPGR
jgi:hypothetical protein